MLTREQILERNKLIGLNGFQTRQKRMVQSCKTFKFKIDYNNLNLQQKEYVKMMFVEAKWIYNIKEDIDIHAANNMIWFYQNYITPGTDVILPIRKIYYKDFVAKL